MEIIYKKHKIAKTLTDEFYLANEGSTTFIVKWRQGGSNPSSER